MVLEVGRLLLPAIDHVSLEQPLGSFAFLLVVVQTQHRRLVYSFHLVVLGLLKNRNQPGLHRSDRH